MLPRVSNPSMSLSDVICFRRADALSRTSSTEQLEQLEHMRVRIDVYVWKGRDMRLQPQQHPQQHTTTDSVIAGLVIMGILVLVIALFGLGSVPAQTVHAAASQQQMSPQTATHASFAAPHEISKTILHETSIDSPAFWTDNCTGPCLPPLYFLAWTGTDAAHHVNYVAPAIATTKVTMPETSIAHPAAVSGGDLNDIIAWTGTDSLHHLNIECVRGCGAVTHARQVDLA